MGELRQYYNNKISDLEKEVKEYDKKGKNFYRNMN